MNSPVPGSNLLDSAFSLICSQSILYYRFLRRETNPLGMDVRVYDDPVAIRASVQPIESRFYTDGAKQFGLDLTRSYIKIWADTDLQDIYRLRSGDQVDYNGSRWEVIGNPEEWFPVDGWNSVVAIEVPTE